MSNSAEPFFLLRAEGRVHTSDVRHVFSALNFLFTSSRDQTTLVIDAPGSAAWPLGDSLPAGLALVGHTAFVNFAILHPGMPLLDGEPCVITGGNDKHVALWNPQTATLEAVIDGHNHGVCCGLVVGPTTSAQRDDSVGDIVTGDWGGVCCVLSAITGEVKQCYRGHSTAVRAVTQLPGTPSIVSASGDKQLHQWDVASGNAIAVYTGHTDVVQCVCAISSTRFASGSNDTTIMIWDVTRGRSPVRKVSVHCSLVYSLCYCSNRQLLFSTSEDRTVKVISGANIAGNTSLASSSDVDDVVVLQSINHPCVVWSVCTTEVGDIVTGDADGVVRVWTLNDELMASVEKLEGLAEAVATQKIDIRTIPIVGSNVADLPLEAQLRQQKGKQEGERRFARTEKGTVEAYAWDRGRWEKVGIVTEGTQGQPYTGVRSVSGAQRPKVYLNGVPYDYVFDVDVNGIMLKLPYNRGQNVFDAAQDFINKNSHVVSQIHKEEIQSFILNNIDPQDSLELAGSKRVPSGAPEASNTDQGAVFSQFAREAAEMRQLGSSHIPSWREALQNMESAGVSDVAFSGYAREGMELQRKQNLQQGGEQRTLQTAGAGGGVVAWSAHRRFTTLNVEGAQKKINELTGDAGCGELVLRVEAATIAAPTMGLLVSIIELYKRLPEASRFPALDLVSHLLASANAPHRWLSLLLDDCPRGGSKFPSPRKFLEECVSGVERFSEAEGLVTVRLFAHAAAALDSMPASATITAEQAQLLVRAFTREPHCLIKKGMSSNMVKSISALLQNVSLLLAHGAHMFDDECQLSCAEGCVRIAAQLLLSEPASSPVTSEIVATILTLLQAEKTAKAVAAAGRSVLLQKMRELLSAAELRCRPAVSKILRVLEAEDP